jgi:hypothetical protein
MYACRDIPVIICVVSGEVVVMECSCHWEGSPFVLKEDAHAVVTAVSRDHCNANAMLMLTLSVCTMSSAYLLSIALVVPHCIEVYDRTDDGFGRHAHQQQLLAASR